MTLQLYKARKKRCFTIMTLMVMLCLFIPHSVHAAFSNSTLQTLDFGSVLQPSAGSQTVIVDSSGGFSGTATVIDSASIQAGLMQWVDFARPSTTVTIDINNIVPGAGLTLGSFTALYQTDGGGISSIAAFPSVRAFRNFAFFQFGATLTVDSSVTPGVKSMTFDVVLTFP